MSACLIPECNRTPYAHDWCLPHYTRWRQTGSPEGAGSHIRNDTAVRSCSADDCEATVHARGMCQPHYIWWWKHKATRDETAVTLLPDSTERMDDKGYVRIMARGNPMSSPKGYVMKHRLVMAEHLGRPLLREENVHHINGITDDNRLENLELWTKCQPSGKRVSELLEWARSLEGLYGTDVDSGKIPLPSDSL